MQIFVRDLLLRRLLAFCAFSYRALGNKKGQKENATLKKSCGTKKLYFEKINWNIEKALEGHFCLIYLLSYEEKMPSAS